MEEILRAIAQKYDLRPSELTGALSIVRNEQSKLAAAQARIAELESALRFYAENPAMGEIARAALAGAEPATRGE